MLVVISPAKTLDFDAQSQTKHHTTNDFLPDAEYLVGKLRKFSSRKLQKMMNISPALGDLNQQRYQDWSLPFEPGKAKQALLAFRGDVYRGLDAESMAEADLEYAQEHLRILSGLYGVLRPLDLIQPYRLEMGTSWAVTPTKKSLYKYWDGRITEAINQALHQQGDDVLVNLASAEYFKAVQPAKLQGRIITPTFLDRTKSGEYKNVMTYAKIARGLMTSWIIRNRVSKPGELVHFNVEGYEYAANRSEQDIPVFIRG